MHVTIMDDSEWLPTREDVVHLVEALGDAWKRRNVEAISKLFAEDATYALRPFAAELAIFRGRDMIKKHWAEQLLSNQHVRRFRHHEHELLLDRDSPRCLAKWEVELEGLHRPMRVLQVAILTLTRPMGSDSPPLIAELETYRHSESSNRAERRGVSPATPHHLATRADGVATEGSVQVQGQSIANGKAWTCQADDQSATNEKHGPDLPRLRITEVPVKGTVHSWKGKFGWILPSLGFDHPSASKHKGRIYIHVKDLVGTRKLKPRSLCSFHVYSDDDGLGAEECTLEKPA